MNVGKQTRRLVRRPRTRRKDVLRKDLEGSGLNLEEAATEARNRNLWRLQHRWELSEVSEMTYLLCVVHRSSMFELIFNFCFLHTHNTFINQQSFCILFFLRNERQLLVVELGKFLLICCFSERPSLSVLLTNCVSKAYKITIYITNYDLKTSSI